MQQAKSGVAPIYHIENVVCNGDLYDPIELYTGTSLYTDDWAIAVDITPNKMYMYPVGTSNYFNVYVNWDGLRFTNSSTETVTKPWNARGKLVATHSAAEADRRKVWLYSVLDGSYTVMSVTGDAIKTTNHQLYVGWDGTQTSGRQFYGTIHDITVWHGYIPTETEIKNYLGIS